MLRVEELHEQAIDIAENAFAAKRRGHMEAAKQLFLEALELEREAAFFYLPNRDSEPTRSILFRSAAALAFHAGDYEQAEQLVSNGLAGFPPPEIKNELRILRDDIEFRYHISLNGAMITEQQMQMTLWGAATGYGIIPVDLLIRRVEQIRTIFYRTVERMAEMPYRVSGRPPKLVTDYYNLYLNALLPGSFGVTFTIGQPVEQLEMFPEYKSTQIPVADVVNEVITCFELIQEDEFDSLKTRFNDDNYLENFIAMAKQMAPDGEDIKVLGLSTYRDGEERSLGFRKNKNEFLPSNYVNAIESVSQERKDFKLEGQLKLADSLTIKDDMGHVKLVDDSGKQYSVRVPISQMQDVVQPYFDEQVVITVYKKGKAFILIDIDKRAKNVDTEITSDSSVPPSTPSLFD